jgi:PPOX class probable FMN-dependent enzyme
MRIFRYAEKKMDDRPAAIDSEAQTIDSESQLRGLYQEPMELALLKQLDRLDDHCRNFIAHSPFVVIGSTRPGRGTDVSPRGDAPGFARVLDANTIAIPDRPGNNRLDTMSNIVSDAEVGLLFFVPGIDETLRINGTARLSREPELLGPAAVNGREPRLVIVVTVREAFLHCGKALKRSRLWRDDYRVDKKNFPSLGRMIVEQTKPKAITVEQADTFIEDNYVTGLY